MARFLHPPLFDAPARGELARISGFYHTPYEGAARPVTHRARVPVWLNTAPAPRNDVAASSNQSTALLRPSEELLRCVNQWSS